MTWISDGESWTFEEGQLARVVRKNGHEERASFSVLKVISGQAVLTDLRGLSRDGWEGPLLTWSGDYDLQE